MDKEDAFIMFIISMIGTFILFIGFIFGSYIGKIKTEELHWQELVKRGYAVEVESSAGKGYKWKE